MQLHQFLWPMIIGICTGILARVLLIQTTYRQFPSKPHGMIIHIFLGFVASLLGAFVIPAVFKPDFTAGVFVSIGTAQFHTIRDLERVAWTDLDKGEVVPRGPAYIDGLTVAFESRIFVVFGVSALTTLVSFLFHPGIGVPFGVILAVLLRFWKQGKSVSDIAHVELAKPILDSGQLKVNGHPLLTLTDADNKNKADDFVALIVRPKDFGGVLTLSHQGQQQAILHNLVTIVGVQDHGEIRPAMSYIPVEKQFIVLILPLLNEPQLAIEAILGAPVLEGVYRKRVTTAI